MKKTTPLAASLASLATLALATAYATSMDCPAQGRRIAERATEIGGRVFAFTNGRVVEVSSASAYCLSCHDGAVAPAVGAQMQHAHQSPTTGADNHPVDVTYPEFRTGFRARVDLNPRLVLDNGLVTCKTCHSGDDPGAGSLSITMSASQLCLACHLK